MDLQSELTDVLNEGEAVAVRGARERVNDLLRARFEHLNHHFFHLEATLVIFCALYTCQALHVALGTAKPAQLRKH